MFFSYFKESEHPSTFKLFEHDFFRNFYKINCRIESEIYLENSSESDDFDSTVKHFNEIFIKYIALILFGVFFPASFMIYYFIILFEIYIDREEFVFLNRRPSPQEMNSIGFFHIYLDLCPQIALMVISYYLSFYVLRLTLNINYIYLAFIVVFAFGTLIFRVISSINPKGTMRMKHLIERQKDLGKFCHFLISSLQNFEGQSLQQVQTRCCLFG